MYLEYMIRNHFAGIYSGMLPDARIEKRAEKIMLALFNGGSAVTNKSCKTGREDKDIGHVTKEYANNEKTNAGFFCHPVFVIDASTQMPVGFSSITLWNRQWDKKNKQEREYKEQE